MLRILALAGFLCIASIAAQAQTEPLIRFGYSPSSPITTFIVGTTNHAFENEGLKFEVQNFTENSPIIEGIVSGQLELGGIGMGPIIQANAMGAPIRIVSAFEYTFTDAGGQPWEAVFLIARKDRDITKVADLKGKKLAVLGFSSTFYLSMRDRLKEAGVDAKDVTFVSIPYTQMAGALSLGEVDAAIITSTEYLRVAQRLPVDVVLPGSRLSGLKLDLTQAIVGKADWLDRHEDAVVRFLKAMLKTRQFMQEDIARNEGASIKRMVKEKLKFDDFLTDTFFRFRAGYAGRELDFVNSLGVPKPVIRTYSEILVSGGLMRGKTPAPYEEIVDLRFLKKAYAELRMKWDPGKEE